MSVKTLVHSAQYVLVCSQDANSPPTGRHDDEGDDSRQPGSGCPDSKGSQRPSLSTGLVQLRKL